MKGKNPTVNQRKLIERGCALNSNEWLVQKDTPTLLQIIHRESKQVAVFEKHDDTCTIITVRRI